ncbi:MAG TPA: cytochrome c maturation protein CcmE [Anaerolineales bacterium]|nr:cytochrome c maturation protein CcmE [Anaerolineales bacterium]
MAASIEMQEGPGGGRTKFMVGGILILAAIVYLIATATLGNQQYFRTVDELVSGGPAMAGQAVRVSGAVLGDTITWDPETLTITFEMAHMPGDQALIDDEGGLARVLHEAVTDPARSRLTIVYIGPMPDLLQHEAQAIVTGRMGEDGVFHAEELLLKCPTRYEEYIPEQVDG